MQCFVTAVNRGLDIYDKLEDGEKEALGRVHISADFLKLKLLVAEWTVADCMAVVQDVLGQLVKCSDDANHCLSVCIDEYDQPCLSAVNNASLCAQFSEFMKQFVAKLKATSDILDLLIIGSS